MQMASLHRRPPAIRPSTHLLYRYGILLFHFRIRKDLATMSFDVPNLVTEALGSLTWIPPDGSHWFDTPNY